MAEKKATPKKTSSPKVTSPKTKRARAAARPEKAKLFLSKKTTEDFFRAQMSGTTIAKIFPSADKSGAKMQLRIKVDAKVPSTGSATLPGIPSEYDGVLADELFTFKIKKPVVTMVAPTSTAQPLEFFVEFDLPGAKVPS